MYIKLNIGSDDFTYFYFSLPLQSFVYICLQLIMSSIISCSYCGVKGFDSWGKVSYHKQSSCRFAHGNLKLADGDSVTVYKSSDNRFHCQGQQGTCTKTYTSIRSLQEHCKDDSCNTSWKAIYEVSYTNLNLNRY